MPRGDTAHKEMVERRMLGLLAEAGLPEPDEIEHEESMVRFKWSNQKVAVEIELTDDLAQLHFV